jgi:eukaryotic translation initiation factor 2-alpha kinase 4
MKSMHNKDIPDADIPLTQLTSWLRGEIREREQRAGIRPHATQHASQHTTENHHHPEQDVHVLVAQTKSKKFNRRTVVEQAQVSAASLVQSFLEGPILAVETTDQVVEGIRETSLSDAESWRKLEQSVNNAERKYIRDVHQELDEFRDAWREKGGSRHAFLYNFRTGNCVYYDLGG